MQAYPSRPRIGPVQFFIIGITLFALKFCTDRVIAALVFGRMWSVLNYLIPFEAYALWQQSGRDRMFYATMLLAAAPFVVAGVVVTLRRLRDAELPDGLVALFFIPAVNLIFFATLSVLPTRRRAVIPVESAQPSSKTPDESPLLEYGHDAPDTTRRFLAAWLPEDATAAAVVAVLAPAPFAIAIELLSVYVFHGYGLGLFVAMPFVLGFVSVILFGARVRRRHGACIGIGVLSLIVSGGCMITFAIEGLGCLIMLAPLAVPITLMGAELGYSIQSKLGAADHALLSAVAMVPLLVCGEALNRPPASLFAVTTSVIVNAPPEVVWRHVVSFRDIPKPTDWMFRIGVAYPVRAVIASQGVGAMRRCEFSTGAFIEPIEVWDQPHLLKFAVTDNPPSMREWSPFNVNAPHLHDFLTAREGQFLLVDLGDGRTRIDGTTWYQHHMWPESYWRLWSDAIVHRIHTRVLEHIKNESEIERTRIDSRADRG